MNWAISAALLLSAFGQDGPAPDAAPARLTLLVFEADGPVAEAEVRVDDVPFGATDAAGALIAEIPSGRRRLTVHRGGAVAMDLDLLTDAGEIVQIIATLQPDGALPRLDIEASAANTVLAGERGAGSTAEADGPATKQPPGALVGTVTSAEGGGPVEGARVFFTGSAVEARTDAAGRYAAELAPGSYSISLVHPDFATQTLDDIRVLSGKEVTANLELTPAGIQLADYVVTAPYIEGSIASTIEAQRETSAVTDVLGAEQMAAAGDSDAAEALQRVSGLTIEDGKYVLVRGQPYRYTLTLWNGSPLPSPEPLIRTVPLDLFPTGVLAGIDVQKSFTADKRADFGAGLVNLRTRGIPDENFVSLSLSGAYNSVSGFMTGRTYDGGGADVFGYDDGTRALPEAVSSATEGGRVNLDDLPDAEQNALGMAFSNNYAQRERLLPPDVGVGVSGGAGIDIFGDGRLGAIASAKWSNTWRRQERIQRSFAVVSDDSDELRVRNDLVEDRTDFNADIGALLTVKASWDDHEVASNTFYAHQTQQRAQLTTGFIRRSQNGDVRDFLLSWIERELIAQQLTGHHDFGVVRLDYRGMISVANRDAPDRREYSYLDSEGGDVNFRAFGNSGMNRQYNTVQDDLLSFGADVTVPILDPKESWLGVEAKAGVAASFQDRTSVTQLFRWRPDDENGADVNELDPEVLYDPANTGTTLIFRDQSGSSRDDSDGFLDVIGVYGLADLRLGDLFRIVGGLRWETATLEVQTFQFDPSDENTEIGRFEQRQFYPSASGTWFINDDMQMRLAYGRTTSRPNLNELSSARFFDPDSGEGFVGDPELQPTTIDGVDARWEWYPSTTESVSVGGFWKGYTNPIERSFTQVGGSDALGTIQNAQDATVLGVELGGRFEFGRFRDWFDGTPEWFDLIYLMGNLSLMTSEVTQSVQGVDTNATRPLDGQATYALNLQTGFEGEAHDVTVAFNMVGRRLHRAGVLGQPDVFLQDIPSLDATWTWRVWSGDATGGILRVKGSNLLNPTFTYKQGDEVWRSYSRGLGVGVDFKLTFL